MAGLIRFSIQERFFVVVGATALLTLGLWRLGSLPIDAVPDISNVQVQINTPVASLGPEEIEKLVTIPMEIAMAGLPNLVEMRSLSKFGLSQVTLIFTDKSNIYRCRQLVNERLATAKDFLPEGLSPEMAPISTGLGEIVYYSLSFSEDAPNRPASPLEQLMELKLIQQYLVRPAVRSVRGVADVNTTGGYEKLLLIEPDPPKLFRAGVTLKEVADAVSENLQNAGGGILEQAGEQVVVRSLGKVLNVQEIENLPIRIVPGARTILVRDIGKVGIGARVRTGAATENGREAVLGTVLMLMGENGREVARQVREKLQEIQKTLLPKGVVIRLLYDRSQVVERTIATVRQNLTEGALLVAAVLFLTLGNVRAALLVASVIPLAFLFATSLMGPLGVSGNLMSLGALDFGLIVDGAVVMVEAILRELVHLQSHRGRSLEAYERRHVIEKASIQAAPAVFFAVIIITVVYFPILSLTGVEGKMFRPMATTVILALVGSLLLSFTYVPAAASYVFVGRLRESAPPLMRLMEVLYRKSLPWSLGHGAILLVVSLALLAVSFHVFRGLGADFVPKLDEGSFVVSFYRTRTMALSSSLDWEERAERLLLQRVREVDYVYSRIGMSDTPTDPASPNESDLYVMLKSPDRWRKKNGRPISKDELSLEIFRLLSLHAPGQKFLFSQPIENRFNEMLMGIRADVSIKIFGPDYDVLERLAKRIQEIVSSVPGAADVAVESAGWSPTLEFVPDRKAMAQYHVHASELNDAVTIGLLGKDVGLMIEGWRRYWVAVRLPDSVRSHWKWIWDLPVRNEEGRLLHLGQIAQARVEDRPRSIARENWERRRAVLVNIRGRDLEGFVREAEAKVRAQLSLPEGYRITFGGQFENLQAAKERLRVAVPLALILIYLLLYAAFRSFRQATLVLASVPFAATGGVFALKLRGLPFSISAAIGFIAVSGIAVLGAIVLVRAFNTQIWSSHKPVRETLCEACFSQFRPIAIAALVASLGFVPMAISHGPGADVQRPLAIVVIGGILSATVLSLFLVPILYRWAYRSGPPRVPQEPPTTPVLAGVETDESPQENSWSQRAP